MDGDLESEALLRRVELNKIDPDNHQENSEDLMAIARFLIEKARRSHDWRYLNAALKLNDLLGSKLSATERESLEKLANAALSDVRASLGLTSEHKFTDL